MRALFVLSKYLNVLCIYILCICVQCFTFYIKQINQSITLTGCQRVQMSEPARAQEPKLDQYGCNIGAVGR